MASDDKNQKGRVGNPARVMMTSSNAGRFDMWLQKQLHTMYDEIAGESVPDDLIDLIGRNANVGKPSECGKE